jgi:single-stranded-DNA-specific exonuclease
MPDTHNNPSSLRNRKWNIPYTSEGHIDVLVAGGASALSAPILAARDFQADTLEDFLDPKLRNLLPNPSFFKDMDVCADRMVAAIMAKENIVIWSDYDVDGATSAAILGRYLKKCNIPVTIRIPDRITEGYGPNAEGLLQLDSEGADLVCILDAGTVAFEPLQAAYDANMDIIVVDHHAAEADLPPAVGIVNPNRQDQEPGYGHLCAAGMTFIFIVAVNLRLRKANFFKNGSPDMMEFMDLVALGTVCDVVPLTTLNRAFVMRGLPILSDRSTPGINALAAVSKCADAIGVRECGFALGPRINAGGRIGDSSLGARLLLEEDPDVAMDMAKQLSHLNNERQDMEKSCTQQAMAAITDFIPGQTRKLAVAVVDAHEGVVGISASRLKDAVDAPAFVLASTPEGTLKGSGRSVPGFDLGGALIAARKEGLILKGGGHAMAGGMTLEHEQLEAFTNFMNARIEESDYYQTGVVSRVDMHIPLHKATLGLIDAVQHLAPFGMGNPSPRFVVGPVLLAKVQVLKDTHLKLIFQDPDLKDAGPQLEGLMWNEANTPFANALLPLQGDVVYVLGGLEINTWNGRSKVQMKLDDVMNDTLPKPTPQY